MTSTTASAIRPGLRENRQLSGSPHTPSRFIPSNYSSPGSTFRQEEDAVILEIDSRRLRAGFEGESGPQCCINFSPSNSRRVGDYRDWLPDYRPASVKLSDEVKGFELWRSDLQDVDLGLVEDKLERAVREAYNKYLLSDAGGARLVIALPSVVPLPILNTMLTLLFERWKIPTITLLPSPALSTVAAGLRTALVVDIGWEESTITPVHELREMASTRTSRACKLLTMSCGEKLQTFISKQSLPHDRSLRLDFEFVEDAISRLASCQRNSNVGSADDMMDWPWHSSSTRVAAPRAEVCEAVRECFFGRENDGPYDDNELPLAQAMYECIRRLPPDTRGLCVSRIVFVGAGSKIHGLQQQVVTALEAIVKSYSWNAVRGQRLQTKRKELAEIAQARSVTVDAKHNQHLPAGKDYVEEKLQKQRMKEPQPGIQGAFRVVNSLGPWAGASLATSLKVKGVVEVERDRFLSHGLSGASKEADVIVVPIRTSGFGVGAVKGTDRTGWTLAGFG